MGLGSVVSGLVGGKGAKKAYKAQRAAAEKAMKEYQNAYNDVSTAYNYYLPSAQQGWNNYVNTLNGDTSAFEASPFGQAYNQYVMDNTINNLQGTAAAKGSLLSGNTMKELQTNIQSILSNDYLNRLGQYLNQTSGLGSQAIGLTDTMNQYRWNQASANAGQQQAIGQARAAQQLAKYNNLGNIWGGIVDEFTMSPKEAINWVGSVLGGGANPTGSVYGSAIGPMTSAVQTGWFGM